jgi:hypothetical protein
LYSQPYFRKSLLSPNNPLSLKKLKESKGQTDFNELSKYIINSVSKKAGLNGKIQTPEVNVSSEVDDKWKLWKLK